jgi:hypothetical protein
MFCLGAEGFLLALVAIFDLKKNIFLPAVNFSPVLKPLDLDPHPDPN